MCVAVVLPPNAEVSNNRLRACFSSNPDGAGFGYYNGAGKQIILKGFMKFNEFLKEFEQHRSAN
jgi:hypothetical protein